MNEMQNLTISECLRAMADLLQAQGANPFRVSAYRKAADAVVQLAEDLAALFEREGVEGLDAIPGVGRGIASAIAEMVITGRWGQLERLRGSVDPVRVFQTVPGIGEELMLHGDVAECLQQFGIGYRGAYTPQGIPPEQV